MSNSSSGSNLVANPSFSGEGDTPGGWSYESPRPGLALGHRVGRNAAGDAVLVLEATNDRLAFGCWRGTLNVEPMKWYEASVKVRAVDIEDPTLSVFAQAARHYLVPAGPWREETVFRQRVRSDRDHVYQGNHFEVYLRAATQGRIEISDPSFVEIPEPDFRMARVASIRFDHEVNNLTMEQQRDRLVEQLNLAGGVGPDIVITTEFTPVIGVPESEYGSFWNAAEAVPDGPVCRIASAAAKRHNMHVIVGNIERRGAHMFNTAVLFGRDGSFIGQYDKTHLTFGELELGVSCGADYPLFDLDFGRIGIHICYDEWFPEVARHYAHQGADILFLCVAGGKPITWRTRALDNGVHLVAASTGPPAMIIESSGEVVAENHRGGFAWADLNLDYRQTNAYRDPTLAYGMPCIVPQMRNVLDHQLLDDLSRSLRERNRP